MDANLKAFTLSVILIAGIGTVPAFGQIVDPITVTTDKESYSEGDTIMVTGDVRDLLSGHSISLQVIAPNGNLVTVDQLPVGQDKKFSTELVPGGLVWKYEGTYTIEVVYGLQRTAETMFTFGGITDVGPDPGNGTTDPTTSVTIEGAEDPISYSITGGTVISMEPDVESKSLIITISAEEDGSLTLTIPRYPLVMDALNEDGTDDDYFVLVDLAEAEFEETKTQTHRTLTIEFPAGTEQIEIIGTWIIPEFGAIAAMILAVAIISIIAVSARSRLSIMPRY